MAISRQLLKDQVKEQLIGSIMSGAITGGQRLVELDLAEQFGVSQAPVREALRDLEAVGLVTIIPHRGTFAADFGDRGSKAMHEIFQVRAVLEELGTRLAMANLADRIPELQHEVDEMCAAARAQDIDGVSRYSERFHSAIMEASGNATLVRMWRALDITVHTAAAVEIRSEHLVPLAESHQPMVDAIASGDVELACAVTRAHQTIVEDLPQDD